MSQLFSSDNEQLPEVQFCRAVDKISTQLDGETVILDTSTGSYSSLDPIGTEIWGLLEKPVKFQAIVDKILSGYEVSEEQCSADLRDFLRSLLQSGLIVVANGEN